jgi:hypothetical protein
MLLSAKPECVPDVIKALSTQFHHKVASDLVKIHKLNINDYGKLKQVIENSSANYFISRAFKKDDHDDYMSIYKIEDLFHGNKKMLLELCRTLLAHKRIHQAKGLWMRNHLVMHPKAKEMEDEIAIIKYDREKDA